MGTSDNPLENKMIEVEMEWRKGSFTGLQRPSMGPRNSGSLNRPSMVSDMSMASRIGSGSSQRSSGGLRGPMLSRPSMDKYVENNLFVCVCVCVMALSTHRKFIGHRPPMGELPPTMEE